VEAPAIFAKISEIERAQRIKRGLPPDHVLSLAEFPFAFSAKNISGLNAEADSYALANPGNPGGHAIRAFVRVVIGDYAEADASLRRFQELRPELALGQMRFNQYPEASHAELPEVSGSWPKEPALFIACDGRYFQLYARPLIASVRRNSPDTRIHVHLMGGDAPGDVESVTYEDPSSFIAKHRIEPRDYYHAARLVRFSEALQHVSELLMVDADALVMGPIDHLIRGVNAAARVRPGRFEPWNHFSACAVRGTEQSRPYLQAVAGIVRSLLPRPFWGLDQYALFAGYLLERPTLDLLGPNDAGITDAPGRIWFTASVNRENLPSLTTPFAKAFRYYAQLTT